MDILYILGKGQSLSNNNEFRYSLRSIDRYGQNIDRVFVVGYCPEWLSDEVVKIPFTQPHGPNKKGEMTFDAKSANILASILYAVDVSDIGDEFLVSMDDYIYIRETDFDNYPFYCRLREGEALITPADGNFNGLYHYWLFRTAKRCKIHGLSEYNFTLHRNMHLCRRDIDENREFLNRASLDPSYSLESIAYLINYRYTKHHDFEITYVDDIKLSNREEDLIKADPELTEVISTADFREGSILDRFLSSLFPDKSKYEL